MFPTRRGLAAPLLALFLALSWTLHAGPASAQTTMSHIQLGKTSYQNGESMIIRALVRAPETAVLAILPASVAETTWEEVRDRALVSFPAAEDVSLTVKMLPAPQEGGEYEVRLYEHGGQTGAVAFRVEQTNSLRLERSDFTLGEPLNVTFKAGTISVPNERDWTLVLVARDEPRSDLAGVSAMESAGLGGEASGRIELTAPMYPGRYQVRMYNGAGREMAVADLSVYQASRLDLAGETVTAGREITVAFQADHLPHDAWIGIVPAGVDLGDPAENLAEAVARQPLNGLAEGSMTFTAPDEEGCWEVRMFSSKTGRPLDTAPFETVLAEDAGPEPAAGPTPGPAVEIEPAAPPLAMESAPTKEPVAGPAVESAPPAAVEVRTNTLRLDKKLARPGEPLTASFTAASTPGDTAWIGIVPVDLPRKGIQNIRNASPSSRTVAGLDQGDVTLTTPEEPGFYEVRFYASTDGPQLASQTFEATIRATSIHLEKNRYGVREPMEVYYSVEQAGPGAWIGIVPGGLVSREAAKNSARAQQKRGLEGRNGGSMSFTAPAEPGLYELRMFDSETDGTMLMGKMFLVR